MSDPIKDQVHIIAQEIEEMIIELFPEHIAEDLKSVIVEEVVEEAED